MESRYVCSFLLFLWQLIVATWLNFNIRHLLQKHSQVSQLLQPFKRIFIHFINFIVVQMPEGRWHVNRSVRNKSFQNFFSLLKTDCKTTKEEARTYRNKSADMLSKALLGTVWTPVFFIILQLMENERSCRLVSWNESCGEVSNNNDARRSMEEKNV